MSEKEAVFYHTGPRSISNTGAILRGLWAPEDFKPASRSTQLEELVLLNCDIGPEIISEILSYPRALKSFTFKGQMADCELGLSAPMIGTHL